ncbi:MAG: hypothetical protein JKY08_12170 [Flavobacteriaceae bacterium]|nr:hypothetical protein [Flavobacteriaceae bacterium]
MRSLKNNAHFIGHSRNTHGINSLEKESNVAKLPGTSNGSHKNKAEKEIIQTDFHNNIHPLNPLFNSKITA